MVDFALTVYETCNIEINILFNIKIIIASKWGGKGITKLRAGFVSMSETCLILSVYKLWRMRERFFLYVN